MIYLHNIDLNQNQLMNAILQPLAVAPANPKLGQLYCDSANYRIKWYNGTEWKVVGVVVESSSANGSIKVDGVEMTVYTLPKASADTLGGIKVGAGLTIDSSGVLSSDVVNNLTSDDIDKPLSAAMGKSLKASINQITTDIGDMGGGDMMKATYDSNNSGVIDDSEKLGGQLPSYYAKAADVPDTVLKTFSGTITANSLSVTIPLGDEYTGICSVIAKDTHNQECVIIDTEVNGTNLIASIASAYAYDIQVVVGCAISRT